MYSALYNCTSENFKRIFQESLMIHASSYDPTPDLRERAGDHPNAVRCYLPLEAKAMRFFRYCEENHKTGRIFTSDYQMQTFTTAERGLLCFVTVKADVFIDEVIVGSAITGQCCSVGDVIGMDSVLQLASGLAKSRALTNAGFGIVDGTDVDVALLASENNGNISYTVGVNPSGNTAPEQGAVPPNPVGTHPVVDSNIPNCGSNASAPNIQPGTVPADPFGNPVYHGQASLFQQLGGQNDPLTRAKTMLYPLAGYYQGKTLGSLTTKTLETLANKATNDPVVEAAVQAARLILEDRNKANGKVK